MDALTKNAVAEAEIVGYGADGAGVARINGQVVFVPGAARGDRCRLAVTKALKTRAYARIDALLAPSPHRIDNDCPAFPRCGGCDFRHITYAEELALKAERVRDALSRIGGVDPGPVEIVASPRVAGYRNKAQFPVSMGPEGPVYGFYRRRSHDLVALTACAIQDERACALAGAAAAWAGQTHTSVYDEASGRGQLRHLLVRTGSRGSHLCLVMGGGAAARPELLADLCRRADPTLTGIVVNHNPGRGNRILGARTTPLWGADKLEESLMGFDFSLSPPSFFQVNRAVTERLYARILDWAGPARGLALDLYCGIGTITLALAGRFDSVVGVEVLERAVSDGRENAARAGLSHVRFVCADAAQAAERLAEQGARPDLVVCDPPRKGMDAAGLAAIAAMGPGRVLYVACDPASLARDVAELGRAGYRLKDVTAFDMFPRTANVETLCLLVRHP